MLCSISKYRNAVQYVTSSDYKHFVLTVILYESSCTATRYF